MYVSLTLGRLWQRVSACWSQTSNRPKWASESLQIQLSVSVCSNRPKWVSVLQIQLRINFTVSIICFYIYVSRAFMVAVSACWSQTSDRPKWMSTANLCATHACPDDTR